MSLYSVKVSLKLRAGVAQRPIFASLPQQGLDSIPPFAAKQKQAVGKRVQFKLLLYDLSQSVYSTPQVGVTTGQIDMIYPADVTQHAGFLE